MSVVGMGEGDRKAGGGVQETDLKREDRCTHPFLSTVGKKTQLFLPIDTNTFCFHLFSSSYNKSAVSFF